MVITFTCSWSLILQPVMPPLTPQTPLTPDSMGQISPHPGMSAFTYPPAPATYDSLPQTLPPTTPTQPSPIVTYHQNPIWGSPSNSVGPFETTTDFSSPIVSERQAASGTGASLCVWRGRIMGLLFAGVGGSCLLSICSCYLSHLCPPPQSTEHQQTFIYSTASTTQPSHFAF